jgi:hypothetical protein
MRAGFTSFNKAACGFKPSETESPPQKGSTKRTLLCLDHSLVNFGSSQRFPPAHFNGGLNADNCGFTSRLRM